MPYTSRLLLLTGMIVTIAFAVASTTLYTLYHTALQQEHIRLTETVQSQARLIEAIAEFDKQHHATDSDNTSSAVLEQIRNAHANYVGLGETGEFTLATLSNDLIVFLLSHRHADAGRPTPIPFESDLAEPMRRALSGEATTLIGLDYRGETVLAATEPVKGLNWGLVAKIDLREIQAQFIRAGLIALALTSILSIAGVALFRRLTSPMIAQLEMNEARYHAVFDQAAVGIARVSPEGAWLEVNQKLCDIVGYSRQELLSRSFQDITHPEDLNRDLEYTKELLAGKRQTYSMEKRYFNKNGDLVWINLTASLVRNEYGQAEHFIAVIEDINERKSTEQALAARENFITRTLDASQTGMYIYDLRKNRIEFINSRYTTLTGYRLLDLQTMSAQESAGLNHADDKQRWEAHFALLKEADDGEFFEIRYKFRRADGSWITCLSWDSIFDRDEDGKVVSIVGTFLDITEQEKDQEKLRQAAIILANTIEGVVVTDTDGHIIDINPAFSNITGYERDEVIGQNMRIVKSDQHDTDFYRRIWKSLKIQGYWHGEIWNRRKDGVDYPALQTISSVYDETGKTSQYIGVFSDITKIKQTEKELEYLAHHDTLTELPNRLLFSSYLQQSIKLSARQGKSLAVIFIDIDQFKSINDRLGHNMGDALLKLAAKRMTDAIRDQDIVSRYSGDEFVVLLEDIENENHAVIAVKKLMAVFAKVFSIDGNTLRVTASMGICLYPQDAEDAATLMRYADAAMYRAKEAGRNRYRFFTPEMDTSALEHALLSNALCNAIKQKEISLHYQPQLDLHTNRVVGVESLLRWQHPSLGLLLPARFLPIAEQSGVVKEIGQLVIEEVCQQGKSWLDANIEFGRLVLNVSSRQLQSGKFVKELRDALERHQFPPQCLELDITESAIMKHAKDNISVLQELRHLGVTIAIDDFGTGYSSLSYLPRLPIDKLKIDQSFIKNVLEDAHDATTVASVIALGNALSMAVVAEGIETEAQVEFLKGAGCQYGQGCLYGMPTDAAELTKQLCAINNSSKISSSDLREESGRKHER